MTKEVIFDNDFPIDGEVYDLKSDEAEKELGTNEIEKLPEFDTENQIKVSLKKKREATREKLAYVFVIGVFSILIIGSIFGFASNKDQVQNITDLVLAFSGVLSGPLGFIIGYYFKRQEEEEKK